MRFRSILYMTIVAGLCGCKVSSVVPQGTVKKDSLATTVDSTQKISPQVAKIVAGKVTRIEPEAYGPDLFDAYYLVASDLSVCKVEAPVYAVTNPGDSMICHWGTIRTSADLKRRVE